MVNTGVPKSEYRLFSSYQVARKITENGVRNVSRFTRKKAEKEKII